MITRELQIALHIFNRGIERARQEYREQPSLMGHRCPDARCTEGQFCPACRERAKADLLVATSPKECAELLAIIDLCGTPNGYQRHRRRGEPTCRRCRRAWATYCARYKAARA